MLYAFLKGYKLNVGTIIENSIMRYHEGNKRGLIPHPATITILCLKAGVKGVWEEEEEVPLTSPLLLTGVSKGPINQKKKGVLIETRKEAPVARQEEENPETSPETNTFTFADNEGQDERSPLDFSIPLASSPPMQNRTFREQGESSRGAQENNSIMEVLKLSHESFYNNQFERDSQLLTIMKKREEEQIKGFKFLYKSLQTDFDNKLDDRDNKQTDAESYRQKEWLQNLDLINNNLSKFLEEMTEMENTMNGLGKRQDELNKKVDLSNEIFIEEQIERETKKRKERGEMKFPPFPAHLGTLDLDPPNIFATSSKIKR